MRKRGLNLSFIVLISFFSLLVLSPIIITFSESVFIRGGVSFSLYKEILTDRRLLKIFAGTALTGLGTAAATLFIALPFAYILERTALPFRKLFAWLYLVPLLIPPYIQGLSWINLLGRKEFLGDFIIKTSRITGISFNLYSAGGIIFIFTLSYFPFACLFLIAGLRAIDRRMEEAGVLIASSLKSFKKITLPLMLPYIFTSFAFVFILTISQYALPELLRNYNYAFEVYYQFDAFHNFAKAAALAFPPITLMLLLIILLSKVMLGRPYISLSGHYRPSLANEFHLLKIPCLFYVLLIISLSVFSPLWVLIKGTASLNNLIFALGSSLNEVLLSILLAVSGATLCTALSLPLAYLLENSRGIKKKITNILTLVPLAVPGPVIGLGLVKLWNRPQTFLLSSTYILIFLAYLSRFSCYGIRIISSALKTYSKEFREAALLIPVSRLKRFFKIIFPLIHPALVITWLISFIFCITELSATLFIIPAGERTLTMRIESLLHQGNIETIFAMCLVQIFITIVPVLILFPYAKFRTRYNT